MIILVFLSDMKWTQHIKYVNTSGFLHLDWVEDLLVFEPPSMLSEVYCIVVEKSEGVFLNHELLCLKHL